MEDLLQPRTKSQLEAVLVKEVEKDFGWMRRAYELFESYNPDKEEDIEKKISSIIHSGTVVGAMQNNLFDFEILVNLLNCIRLYPLDETKKYIVSENGGKCKIEEYTPQDERSSAYL